MSSIPNVPGNSTNFSLQERIEQNFQGRKFQIISSGAATLVLAGTATALFLLGGHFFVAIAVAGAALAVLGLLLASLLVAPKTMSKNTIIPTQNINPSPKQVTVQDITEQERSDNKPGTVVSASITKKKTIPSTRVKKNLSTKTQPAPKNSYSKVTMFALGALAIAATYFLYPSARGVGCGIGESWWHHCCTIADMSGLSCCVPPQLKLRNVIFP